METEIGKEVVDEGGKHGDPPLHKAARNGHYELVKLLLTYRADPETLDGNGRTALQQASDRGREDVVILLLENGADPNSKDRRSGFTALHAAAQNGRYRIAEILLEKGADPCAKAIFGEKTPVELAQDQNYDDLAEMLKCAMAQ